MTHFGLHLLWTASSSRNSLPETCYDSSWHQFLGPFKSHSHYSGKGKSCDCRQKYRMFILANVILWFNYILIIIYGKKLKLFQIKQTALETNKKSLKCHNIKKSFFLHHYHLIIRNHYTEVKTNCVFVPILKLYLSISATVISFSIIIFLNIQPVWQLTISHKISLMKQQLVYLSKNAF